MSDIEYHVGKLAINVKDHHIYNLDPRFADIEEPIFTMCYEDCKDTFWNLYAQDTARFYSYGKAYSEGRSEGWLVVENSPDFDDFDFELEKIEQRKCIEQWEAFQRDILDHIHYCCNERLLSLCKEISLVAKFC